MALRGRGCLTIPAMVGVVGFWLILAGSMGENERMVKNGLLCLVGALALLGAVFYVRWQGWAD